MYRTFERAARARRRKAAIYTALITTTFFGLLILLGTDNPGEYLPEFVQEIFTETPAPSAETTTDTVRP